MSDNSGPRPRVGKQIRLSFAAAQSLALLFKEKKASHDRSYHRPLEFTPKRCEKSGLPLEQCDICSEHER